MKSRISQVLVAMALFIAAPLYAQQTYTLAEGTEIKVRADRQIDADASAAGRVYPATISEPVNDANGNLLIPRGAPARLRVMKDGSKVMLDLASISVNNQRYTIEAKGEKTGGVGLNKRTAIYTGGGAVAGALLGGLIGGGKGAAIGTLLGGAAGAGTQVYTSGKRVKVPAEGELSFKLAQDVEMRAVRAPVRRRAGQ